VPFTGPVESLDRRPVVAPHIPAVPGPKLEFAQFRLAFNRLYGIFKLGYIDSIDND
jgi:hypothetical protein